MERGLYDERAYDAESRERSGLSRRRLLQAGGASLAALSLGSVQASPARAADGPIVKPTPPDLFIPRGTNAEMRWEAMRGQGYLTPTDRFFVRNHTGTPRIDLDTWRLRVHGSGVRRELSVSYEDLLRLPSVTLNRFVECAGNGRSLFGTRSRARLPPGPPGTRCRRGRTLDRGPALLRARACRAHAERHRRDARRAGQHGGAPADATGEGTRGRHPAGLRHERQGAAPGPRIPVRVLLPGWVGVSNVKWVGSIEVSEEPLYSQWNTTATGCSGPPIPTPRS